MKEATTMEMPSTIHPGAMPVKSRLTRARTAWVGLGLAISGTLAMVGPVAAVQPFSSTFVDGPHIDTIGCGSMTATLVRTLTGTDTYFVDGNGDLIREQVVAHMVGTLTADTGMVVALRGNLVFIFDPVKGTFTFNGQVFMANRPGLGVVIQDTGRYVSDWDNNTLFDAGPHQVVDGDGSIFCSALRAR